MSEDMRWNVLLTLAVVCVVIVGVLLIFTIGLKVRGSREPTLGKPGTIFAAGEATGLVRQWLAGQRYGDGLLNDCLAYHERASRGAFEEMWAGPGIWRVSHPVERAGSTATGIVVWRVFEGTRAVSPEQRPPTAGGFPCW